MTTSKTGAVMKIGKYSFVSAIIFISFASFAGFNEMVLELSNAAQAGNCEEAENILHRMYLDNSREADTLPSALLQCSQAAYDNGHELLGNRLRGLYEVSILEETDDSSDEEIDYPMEDLSDEDEGEDEGDPEISLTDIIETSTRETLVEDVEDICDSVTFGVLPETIEERDIVCDFLRTAMDTDLTIDLEGEAAQPMLTPEAMQEMIRGALETLENLTY